MGMRQFSGIGRNQFLALFLAGLFFIFGCTKTAEKQEAAPPPEEEFEALIIPDPAVPQGVLVIDGSLQFFENAKMNFKAYISAGETVEWTGEKKDAILAYDGKQRTFCRVIAELTKGTKEEFWVQQYYIYGPAKPAVITNADAVLYNSPDPGAVDRIGKVTLPKYAFVAMRQDDDLTDDFIPIAAQLGLAAPTERWVKIKDLSWDTNVVQGIKLARKAASQPNVAARRQMLSDAMDTMGKGSLVIPPLVRSDAALFELEFAGNLELLTEQKRYMVNTDSVNVRDFPSINSNVVDQYNSGRTVTITARSKNKTTIKATVEGEEDMTGNWFRTDTGGWIFSYFLSSYDDRDW